LASKDFEISSRSAARVTALPSTAEAEADCFAMAVIVNPLIFQKKLYVV
jgi:hypothetical protein